MNQQAKKALQGLEAAVEYAEHGPSVWVWFALASAVVHALLAIAQAIDEVCEKLPEDCERR